MELLSGTSGRPGVSQGRKEAHEQRLRDEGLTPWTRVTFCALIRCRRLSPVVWRMRGLLPAPRCELTCLLQGGPGRVAPPDVRGWGRALLLTVGMSQSFWCKWDPAY